MAEVNQRISEYVLDQLIGQNSLAQVFKAHHHMWAEQVVAVKVPTDDAYVQNLRKEGVRLHLLAHANIVRAIGFDPTATPPYLITEFLPGGNLRPLIGYGKLAAAGVIRILRQVLTGLQHAHEKGVVHGDLKPENILLEAQARAGEFVAPGCVKISDFGVGATAAATTLRAASETGKAAALAYLAPEQREGHAPDALSDIYSVGVILFELLTGERPGGLELPSEINPAVPKTLDEVFRRCYARRERRFVSITELLAALPADSAEPVIKAVAAPAPPPPPPAQEKSLDEDLRIAPRKKDAAPVVMPPPSNDAALDLLPEESSQAVTAPTEPPAEDSAEDTADGTALGEEAEEIHPQTDVDLSPPPAPGDTKVPVATEAASPYPTLPKLSRHPSRADENAVFDELQNKQLRSPAEVKTLFRQLTDARTLDQEETANIRIRVLRWANSLAGEDSVLDEQLVVTSAKSQPVYLAAIRTRFQKSGGEIDDVRFNRVPNRAVDEDARSAIAPADYHPLIHLSAGEFQPDLLLQIPQESLRGTILDLVSEVKQGLHFPLVRQDVLVFRASAIVVEYQFDQQPYSTVLIGDQLEVFGGRNPFQAIGEDPTKRAAALLDADDCRKGIGPLRRALDTPRWHDRAVTILSAFRGKLAAAYLHEARIQFDQLGWLESLEFSAKAGLLVPGSQNALEHAAKVAKRVTRLHLLPASIMMVIFLGITALHVFGGDHGSGFKAILLSIISQPFFYAAVGAIVTGLITWRKLGTRLGHTDLAFYHAMVMPLAVGGFLAFTPERLANPPRDVVCGLLLAVVIAADLLVFRYFPRRIYRQQIETQMTGDSDAALSRIEALLEHDWERLRPHYITLGPLYTFSGAQRDIEAVRAARAAAAPPPAAPTPPRPTMGRAILADAPAPASEDKNAGDDESALMVVDTDAAPAGPPVTGDAAADALLVQYNNRINAGLRALAAPGRMLITLVMEYEKSVNNRQLGMMQTNATKIEQKAKDLTKKLAEVDALSKSPLSLDSRESPRLRQAHDQIAKKARGADVQVLAALAKQAMSFREDQTSTFNELRTQLAQAQQIIERFKKL